jgi:hypothetical protein
LDQSGHCQVNVVTDQISDDDNMDRYRAFIRFNIETYEIETINIRPDEFFKNFRIPVKHSLTTLLRFMYQVFERAIELLREVEGGEKIENPTIANYVETWEIAKNTNTEEEYEFDKRFEDFFPRTHRDFLAIFLIINKTEFTVDGRTYDMTRMKPFQKVRQIRHWLSARREIVAKNTNPERFIFNNSTGFFQ